MTFLGINDILLLSKNDGKVHRILNDSLLEEPILDVNVANKRERGLLGISSSTYSIPNDDKYADIKYVFLYFTESNKDGNDLCPNELVNFGGNGRYGPPEFIWKEAVAPTAIKFLHSNKYGKDHKDDLFVGDINNGNLYHFDLNKDRSGLLLNGRLQDKLAR